MTEQQEKKNALARDVIRLSRNTLLVHLRFLDMALSRLRPVATELTSFATDGQYLAYEPDFVLRRYKQEKELPVRDYLHTVFHCVFRHMFIHHLLDQDCWDLACDVAVEGMISELGLKAAAASREQAQQAELARLRKEVKQLTAEKLYRYILDHRPSERDFVRLHELFAADDHGIWYLPPEEKIQITIRFRAGAGVPQTQTGDGQQPVGADDHIGPGSGQMSLTAADAEADWEDVSRRMQQDLETFSKLRGDTAGGLMQNLAAVNREKYDYTSFLK